MVSITSLTIIVYQRSIIRPNLKNLLEIANKKNEDDDQKNPNSLDFAEFIKPEVRPGDSSSSPEEKKQELFILKSKTIVNNNEIHHSVFVQLLV